jgi:polyphenol oxidase
MTPWHIGFEKRINSGNIRAYFFGRQGGASKEPFNSLNLGVAVGDRPQHIAKNEINALKTMNTKALYLPRQIHGTDIYFLENNSVEGVVRGDEADAVVTRLRGIALGILTADCVPILLADTQSGITAAVHAGWRGLADGVIPKCLEKIAGRGAFNKNMLAFIGPSIGPCCYEVSEELAMRFERGVEGGRDNVRREERKAFIDLPGVAYNQLLGGGLSAENITCVKRCTSCEPQLFFSHRRDKGKTGRQLSAIVMTAD